MANEQPAIVGVGARTSIGVTAEAASISMWAGITRFESCRVLMDRTGKPFAVAQDPFLPVELAADRRLTEMLTSTSKQALAPIAGMNLHGAALDVWVALPEERPGLNGSLSTRAVERFRQGILRSGLTREFRTLTLGRAGGLMAVQAAVERLERQQSQLCLLLGADSYVNPLTLDWLDRDGRLHTAERSWGFVPGEAAGACLLASTDMTRSLGLPVFGHVVAAHSAKERNLPERGAVCLGDALSSVTRTVLTALEAEERVAQIYADLNGERHRVDEVGFTITRVVNRLRAPSCLLTPAERWGEVGAASGLLFAVLAVMAGRRGKAAGRYSMLWTSGPGEERCAVLLNVPVADRDEMTWTSSRGHESDEKS